MAKIKNYKISSEELDFTKAYPALKPKNWSKAPRIFRIYETEGDEVQSVHWNKRANFTFQQNELRDTMIIDQDSHIWLWSEITVSTFSLKVTSLYLSKKLSSSNTSTVSPIPSATVICRSKEPELFKALFPTWTPFEHTPGIDDDFIPTEPKDLKQLLDERTCSRSLEDVLARNLPKGCDTKNLEQYLSEEDFLKVFKMGKREYGQLKRWRQIELKKEANLF